MRLARYILAMLVLTTLAGCIASYKMEIQQGNVITSEMIEKLKPGMSKSQVRFVLGTPLITDPFHTQRWDYVHVYKKNAAAPPQTRQFTVFFEGDTLTRVEDEGKTVALPSPADETRDMSATPEPTAVPTSSSRAL